MASRDASGSVGGVSLTRAAPRTPTGRLEREWPKVVVVDAAQFYPGYKGQVGFSVLAAYGYAEREDPGRVVALRAITGALSASTELTASTTTCGQQPATATNPPPNPSPNAYSTTPLSPLNPA